MTIDQPPPDSEIPRTPPDPEPPPDGPPIPDEPPQRAPADDPRYDAPMRMPGDSPDVETEL